ncbi:MAG: VTT domain-containing protein [Oscillospiraceae bacterium]
MKLKRILPVIAVLAAVVLFLVYRDRLTVDSILKFAPQNKLLCAAFVMAAFAIKSFTVFFPLVALYVMSGVLFPFSVALLVNIAGTAVCFSVQYAVGRYSVADTVGKLYQKYPDLKRLAMENGHKKWLFPILLRVVGCLPGDLVSMYFGAVKAPYFPYIAGSILGVLPVLVSTSIAGDSISSPTSPQFIISAIFAVAISVCSILYYTVSKNKKKPK